MARLLSGPAAELTAKLTEKSRYRPTALIRRILPAGAECLESVPTLERGGLCRTLAVCPIHQPSRSPVRL